MPIPSDLLERLRASVVVIDGQRLPLSGDAEFRFDPPVWLFNVCPPVDSIDASSDLAALTKAFRQAGRATRSAQLRHPDGSARELVALVDVDRKTALKLAYKRKHWVVVGLGSGWTHLMFTGINSRM